MTSWNASFNMFKSSNALFTRAKLAPVMVVPASEPAGTSSRLFGANATIEAGENAAK